jgi:YhcN/YlaJ family sporulation lipoprotein
MKNSLRTALCILCSFCLFTVILAGCTQAGENGAQDFTKQNMMTRGYGANNLAGGRYDTGDRNIAGGNLTVDPGANNGGNTNFTNNRTNTNSANNAANNRTNNTTGTQMSAEDRQRANTIKKQLMNMNGIEDAEVIVMGNNALIGVRTTGNEGAGQLKSTITRKIRQIDNTIKNVTVSDTSDVLLRMRRLGTGTGANAGVNRNNANGNNVMDDITDEFNRLMQGTDNIK